MKKPAKKPQAKVSKAPAKQGSILFRRYDNPAVFTFFVASVSIFVFSLLYSVNRYTDAQLSTMSPTFPVRPTHVLGASTKSVTVNPEKDACSVLKKQLCVSPTSDSCKNITTVCTKLGYK